MSTLERAQADWLAEAYPLVKGGSIDVITGDALSGPPGFTVSDETLRTFASKVLEKQGQDFDPDRVVAIAREALKQLNKQ